MLLLLLLLFLLMLLLLLLMMLMLLMMMIPWKEINSSSSSSNERVFVLPGPNGIVSGGSVDTVLEVVLIVGSVLDLNFWQIGRAHV